METVLLELLNQGKVEEYYKLKGNYYSLKGNVIGGRKIGRTIGFPTANITYEGYHLPLNGVYGVEVEVEGNTYLGMANIGYNPTFEALNRKSLEVNIFDFNKDIYGKEVTVTFMTFIRNEQKFAGKDKLIEQLNKDKNEIKNRLK